MTRFYQYFLLFLPNDFPSGKIVRAPARPAVKSGKAYSVSASGHPIFKGKTRIPVSFYQSFISERKSPVFFTALCFLLPACRAFGGLGF
jgi:hypothetical protein